MNLNAIIAEHNSKKTEEDIDRPKKESKRMVPITPRSVLKIEEWEIDFRFVREVEHLERIGRVQSRYALEMAVGIENGGIATIRLGMRGVSPANIKRLFNHYRGDKDYILLGAARNPNLADPYIPELNGKLPAYRALYHKYSSPARWRIGPQPEAHPQHYLEDPENKLWTAPTRKNITTLKKKVKPTE